ncbi:MAG: 2-C-methyl-D-erythritol 2,4-cyclodiphosphate synthase [gamma proteobacterium symbiont of Bathyaustriella thionipta]|nr:2-C-methyl-D-erythritol 2,4-cyclodiphosphate synthase [gamma proteobacterium symbiont of Bathyaustriella thionipta]
MRIGHGFDVHRLVTGRPLILGGVSIDHPLGLQAHSDGDVVLHAICDALLGAAALGDIGRHFPDSDARYKNIDSRDLLRSVMLLLQKAHWRIGNLDVTIIAQEPKLAPHIQAMRKNIAQDVNAHIDQINLKATTTEQLGYCGRKEGIAVHAVSLLLAAGLSDKDEADFEWIDDPS